MIVVTGEPRSGTSLVMLMIKELGLTIAGTKYVSEFTKSFNPTGIWEVPGLTYNGVQMPIEEDAIKLATNGFMKSRMSLIEKVVLCIRDPREIIVSQRGQQNHVSDENNWDQYLGHMMYLFKGNDWSKTHIIDYGDTMWSPETEVGRLAKFLNVESTQAAIDCVRPDLYRSKKHKVRLRKKGKAAMKYYEALRRGI
jgi:hypothetical protein